MTNAPQASPIPLSVPEIKGREWEYVKECLDTGWVSSVGPFVDRFEREFAQALGAPHAVAVASGTAALHLALLVAGVRPGDLVIAPTLTFVASINAIRYVGADPILVDAEPDHWLLDPQLVTRLLEDDCERDGDEVRHRATGRRVAAIMPVDLLGHPCDYGQLRPLADRFAIPIVEDATEGLGARVGEHSIGSQADLACYSFNGNKLITTGGGGMLVTADADWARRARHLSTQAKADPVEYVHDDVGFNYRMTNVQAAIGCAQLERLDEFVATKRRIAERYDAAFASIPGILPQGEAPGVTSAIWLYTIRVDAARFGRDARGLMAQLAGRGIQSRPLFQPLHLGPIYRYAPRAGGAVAERLWDEGLSLPCSVGLAPADQDRVISAVREAAGADVH